MSKYLDLTGLGYLWDKIKAKFASVVDAVPLIVSTTTAAGVWTGNAPFATLQDGQSIKYWTSHTGVSGQQTTLNLTLADGETATGAIPVYYRGTSILTNHVPANTYCTLTYRENVTIGEDTIAQGWWLEFAYYKDTDTYNRILVPNFRPTPTKTMYGRQFVFLTDDGYRSITNSNTTNTSHTRCTAGIYNPQTLHYFLSSSSNNCAAGAQASSTMYSALNGVNFRYCANCGTTLTKDKPVYLVFTHNANGLYYLDATWYAQDLPTTEDGKIYMYIGTAYSNYQLDFESVHPMYWYHNGRVVPYAG